MIYTYWLVVKKPSWKMMDFVNGKDYPIYEMENKKTVWNHQPVYWLLVVTTLSLNRLVLLSITIYFQILEELQQVVCQHQISYISRDPNLLSTHVEPDVEKGGPVRMSPTYTNPKKIGTLETWKIWGNIIYNNNLELCVYLFGGYSIGYPNLPQLQRQRS